MNKALRIFSMVVLVRVLLVFWLSYCTIAQLGLTGSYTEALVEFAALVTMAYLGWLERDLTKRGKHGQVK